MFEKQFTELSLDLNYTYRKESFIVGGELGSRLPITIHHLEIDFEGVSICLKYDLGNHNLAEINAHVKVQKSISNFKLETKDHFLRLFSFNKSVWKIKCDDNKLKQELIRILDASGLSTIAQNENFEPEIRAEFQNLKYSISTKYYLGFNNKEKSIKPIIEFHKMLVQYIQKKPL